MNNIPCPTRGGDYRVVDGQLVRDEPPAAGHSHSHDAEATDAKPFKAGPGAKKAKPTPPRRR